MCLDPLNKNDLLLKIMRPECEDGENQVFQRNVQLSKQLDGTKIFDGFNCNINLIIAIQNTNYKKKKNIKIFLPPRVILSYWLINRWKK